MFAATFDQRMHPC